MSCVVLLTGELVIAAATGPQLHVINSGMNNRDITISPDGKTLYTSVTSPKNDHAVILQSHLENGVWRKPELAPFSGQYPDIEPMYSPDGSKLFFASKRPKPDREGDDWDIWYMVKTGQHWSTPKNAGPEVNSTGNEFYPSIAANGNLYFTATREDGVDSEDIYVARQLKEGPDSATYSKAEVVKGQVNTKTYEFNAFVAADESYLIYGSQRREGEIGGGDIYISFRDSEGKFGEGALLPVTVNTNKLDYCPYVWRDTFFFTSERRVVLDNIESATMLKQKFNAPGNGLGDIYSIKLDQILPASP